MLPNRPLGGSSSTASASARLFGGVVSALLGLSFVILPVFSQAAFAQAGNPQPLITQTIDETKLRLLKGNTHPLARAEFDRGAAPASLAMQRMLLVLTRSTAQEAAIQTLLEEQQDKSSPSYHKWLTPDEFGQEFGASEQDIQTITSWLAAHGFQVAGVSRGRMVIEFSGTAAEVQQAFHTAIHSYVVNGKQYWANASDPAIPSALAPVVIGVDSLNNFGRKATHHLAGGLTVRKEMGQPATAKPAMSYACGTDSETGSTVYCNALGPYDFAAIYNVLPLWTASSPIDGTGQSIAIIARSNINLEDVSQFRNLFGLPANPPQIILDGPDPGVTGDDDETEADLDVEWSGAVAKGATIKLVVSESTESTDGIDLSAEYAVDNDVAPVLSESFGNCELAMGTAGNEFYNNLWEQAAAEGISVFVSAGDNGSAGCDFYEGSTPEPANYGLEVSGIASTPYNMSVGGTDFNDFFDSQTYWNTTNNPTTQQSAKGYIPETTWNDSCTNAIYGEVGWSTNAETNCNTYDLSGAVVTLGGSGGRSGCTAPTSTTVSSCAGGYTKPAWQTGNGVPTDGVRDLPDVSLFASNGFLNNFYFLCEADLQGGSCSTTSFVGIGGTSASSPTFAGLLALVNQKTGAAQGNPGFILYKLAAQQSDSSCNSSTGPASTCVFNDVTSGTIAMPCAAGTPNCTRTDFYDDYGVLSGYSAGAGYDLTTGLGSVNANNLVNEWNSVTFTPSTTTLTLNGGNAVNIVHGSQLSVGIAVSPTSPIATGNVSLIATQGANHFDFDTLTLSNGTASGTTNMLPGGASYSVEAHYNGDANYGGSDSNAVTVTVTPETSKTALRVITFNPTSGEETNPNATTFAYGSPYVLRADVTNSSGTDCFSTGNASPTYGCPTGTVALTDNGSALSPGSFGLNSQGNTEDQTIQLTGGSHNLGANYSGDNSYNASSATDSVTVTPAPTTTTITSPNPSGAPMQVTIGQLDVYVSTQSNSSGIAPTGTYTLFDGTTQLAGTVSTNGNAASSTNGASLFGTIQSSISAPSGLHTLTVRYSGDGNYATSTSGPVSVDVFYPTTTTVTANPTNIIFGNTVTATATVDTGNPTSNAALKPTGTISFGASYGSITGTVVETAGQDANGNWMLQATVTITPQQSESVFAHYSGDSNYTISNSGSVFITVTIPDFSISTNPTQLTIPAGQSGTTTLTVTPATNYTSTVQLSCTGSVPGGSCTISPASVTLGNGTAATAMLTIATLAPSNTASSGAARMRHLSVLVPPGRDGWWTLSLLTGLAALFLFILPERKRPLQAVWGLGLICLLSFAIGCGGGTSASGGGGGGSAEPFSTTTTLTASSTKIPIGSELTLTAAVQSAAPSSPTGNVTFNLTNCQSTLNATLTNGTAQFQLNTAGLRAGTCVVTAQYAGDANHQPSVSGPLNIAITGTTQQTIVGQTGGDAHLISLSVTIQ